MSKLKIRVGLPSVRKQWHPATIATFESLTKYDKIDFSICKITGTHCVRARNFSAQAVPSSEPALIKQVLPYDYYLSTDDDMAFCPETIERLIAQDKDVIGAAYPTRDGYPDSLVAAKVGSRGKQDWYKIWDHGLQECDWTGGGCCLIKKEVFENMEYPYFRNHVICDQGYADVCTEDISFCFDARKAGYKIWVDLDNRVAHISN